MASIAKFDEDGNALNGFGRGYTLDSYRIFEENGYVVKDGELFPRVSYEPLADSKDVTWLFAFGYESAWSESPKRFSGKCPPGSFVSRVAVAEIPALSRSGKTFVFGPIQCRKLPYVVLEPGTLYTLEAHAEAKGKYTCEDQPSLLQSQ